ncbi:MAG: DNA mismatch repair endonuclease MutL [Candidatus Latescibacterota bacterium]
MSNRIRVLPEILINKIAAGEVVERPASVVKELVENALDAEAGRISVEVKGGGKTGILVADDGMGMSRDDAILAMERHATSKIASEESLEALRTLGFRGEALPSIGSVARMTLETRERTGPAGTQVVLEGGVLRNVREVGRDVGTTVTVQNLFFNTPARRKFLKSTETEFRHIVETMTAAALAHPRVAFRLVHNGREVMAFRAREHFDERMREIFGGDLMDRTVPLFFSDAGVMGEGVLGVPEVARTSGRHQWFFVNGRPVLHRSLRSAILTGYGALLPRDRVPFFVLFLQIAPGTVDVNVHPTKREVRFSNEQSIYDLLLREVPRALRTDAVVPEVRWDSDGDGIHARGGFPRIAEGSGHLGASEGHGALLAGSAKENRPFQTSLAFQIDTGARAEEKGEPLEANSREAAPLWQVHRKYVFAAIKNGLAIVDQHAAHERVLYEKVMGRFAGGRGTAQQLLFPLTLEFDPTEMHMIQEIQPLLDQIGFGIQCFGRNTVMVDAIPSSLKQWRDGQMLKDLVDEMVKMGPISSGLKEHLAVLYSCHAAIKTGDRLSMAEMQGLVDQLFATQQPFVCPHGRPTVVKVGLEELDRRFGR